MKIPATESLIIRATDYNPTAMIKSVSTKGIIVEILSLEKFNFSCSLTVKSF